MLFCTGFPLVQEMTSEIHSTLFNWATAFFSINDLADFRKYFLGFLRVPFFHRKTYLLEYWTRLPTVGQSVNRNLQSFSQPSPGSGLVFMVDSFMWIVSWLVTCYFIFFTMLLNKCGSIFLDNLKTILSPSQDPKKPNNIDFIG